MDVAFARASSAFDPERSSLPRVSGHSSLIVHQATERLRELRELIARLRQRADRAEQAGKKHQVSILEQRIWGVEIECGWLQHKFGLGLDAAGARSHAECTGAREGVLGAGALPCLHGRELRGILTE